MELKAKPIRKDKSQPAVAAAKRVVDDNLINATVNVANDAVKKMKGTDDEKFAASEVMQNGLLGKLEEMETETDNCRKTSQVKGGSVESQNSEMSLADIMKGIRVDKVEEKKLSSRF